MTDRQAAILFACALAATLDSYGHMSFCMGVYDSPSCDYEPCRRAREAVALAISAGYLPVPDDEVEATRQALRTALDAALEDVNVQPKSGDKSGDSCYTEVRQIEGRAALATPLGLSTDRDQPAMPAPSISTSCAPAHPTLRASEQVGGAVSPCPQGGPMTRG